MLENPLKLNENRCYQADCTPDTDYGRLIQLLQSEFISSVASPEALAELRRKLERATVVKDQAVPATVVTMGAVVQLRDPTTEEDETFKLVYPDNANIAGGKMSVTAPAGAAILGKRVGQSVRVQIPSGQRIFVIHELIHSPPSDRQQPSPACLPSWQRPEIAQTATNGNHQQHA